MKKLVQACACLLAVAALAGCGGSDDDSAASTTTATTTTTESTTTTQTTTTTTAPAGPTEIAIVVENGAPKGGIVRKTVNQGDKVVLVVTSDVADEIHLHGYDKSRDVEAGGTVRLPFTATIPGRFEAELESRGVQIADITVEP
jgi:ABC-type glycerol-3-phosphate transport system substrate-binding protein